MLCSTSVPVCVLSGHARGMTCLQGLQEDPSFKAELNSRLGPGRMQYVHLIDQVVYYEEMMAGSPMRY